VSAATRKDKRSNTEDTERQRAQRREEGKRREEKQRGILRPDGVGVQSDFAQDDNI
jgi:hypothetical protein